MGSRLEIEKAYIAGFLDGDGSIMLQLKKRKDSASACRFMATVCFYQDTRHDKYLYWMREFFKVGYISKRNDGISELKINGFSTVNCLLSDLLPYIRFKKIQAEMMIEACQILKLGLRMLSKNKLLRVIDIIFIIRKENYKSCTKTNKEDILKMFNLTP